MVVGAGLEANRPTSEALVTYPDQSGLLLEAAVVDELFWPDSRTLA